MSVSGAVRNPRAFVGGKWNRFKLLLLDPEQFFEEKPSTPKLWNEILVLVFIGLVGAAGTLYVGQQFMEHFVTASIDKTPDTRVIPGQQGLRIQVYPLRSVVGMFVLWGFFSLSYYVLSWLYSDQGSFFQIVKATAWTLVPIVFTNLVKSIGAVVTATMETLIEDDELDGIAAEVSRSSEGEGADLLFGLLFEEPVMLGALAIGVVFYAWCGYVGAYAVANARQIPVSDAYKVVAVPIILYSLWWLQMVLGHAGVL